MGKQPSKWTPPADDEVIDQKPVMKAWTPPAEDEVVEPVKKKDLTVNEPAQKEPLTKAGSDVSQEPGPKAAQPSGKSTGESDYQQLLEDTEKQQFGIKQPFVESLKKQSAPVDEKAARQVVSDFQKEITGKPEEQEFLPQLGSDLAQIPPSFNKGIVSTAASIPKAVGILAQKLDQLTGMPPKNIEDYSTFQLGKLIEDKAQEIGITAIDQSRAGFLNSTVPMAFGSMMGMMLTGGGMQAAEAGIIAPSGILKQTAKTLTSPSSAVGVMQAAVPEFEAAKQAGKSDEEAFNVFLKNVPGGLTESIQLSNMFARLNKMTNNGIVNAFKSGTANGLEEASQEAFQQTLTNKIAQGTYDPKRDITEGVGEGAGAGFIVGFMMPGIIGAMQAMTPDQKKETQDVLENIIKNQSVKIEPKTPAQVITEVIGPITSTNDTANIEAAADKIISSSQEAPTTTNEGTTPIPGIAETVSTTTTETQQVATPPVQESPAPVGQGEAEAAAPVLDQTTGQVPSTPIAETKSPEPVQEVQEGSQEASMDPFTTVGTNYQKVDGAWQVKQADGTWAPVISNKPNKTKAEQNTELTQMKDLLAQMEAQEPQNLKMSNTEKGNIARTEVLTPRGAVRQFFWGTGRTKGKVLWNTKKDDASSKPRKGIKEESGMSDSEQSALKEYIDDKNGLTPDKIAENLTQDYGFEVTKGDVINVLANTDPKNWYADHLSETDDYLRGALSRRNEMDRIAGEIAALETQEKVTEETNKQLYENERRVNQGSPAEGTGSPVEGDTGEQGQAREGGEGQADAGQSIRENGDEAKSKQALEELDSLVLTHVPGLGMGQNQAKGTYLSTEKEGNRYERRSDQKPIQVRLKIKNPFVTDSDSYADIQRKVLKQRFGLDSIDQLADDPQGDTKADLLAEMMTEFFINEGYDAIYFPQSESQEGEIVVFDRENVIFPDPYADAVHAAMQTKLTLDFVPEAQLVNSDKATEDRMKQRDIRKRLSILNELIKCR